MSESDRKVECGSHGFTPATYVCQHVAKGAGCGFHTAYDDDSDRWPDAWCDLCEEVLQRDGHWTERTEAIARITLLCTHCYEAARELNRTVPAPLHSGHTKLDAEGFADLLGHACTRIKAQQDEVLERFGLADFERWEIDSDSLRIVFSSPGVPSATAEYQVVGTFSLQSNTWLWGWANASFDPRETAEIDRLRVFGEVRGIDRLTHQKWNAEQVDGWEMTSLAAHVLGADALYRLPSEKVMTFLLLRNLGVVQ